MDLFEWHKAVRRSDPETSRDAAREARELAARHHALIIQVLKSTGRSMAAEEIADDSGVLDKVLVGRRLCELERANLIRKTTERHKNRSGRHGFKYELSYLPGAA
jgi:DNA-binding HxlR family transcriptional regulator